MSHFAPKSHFHHPARALSVPAQVDVLNDRFSGHSSFDVLRYALTDMGRMALVSSFGADAVVLLHMTALIDPATPVWMIDTEMLFPETLAYQREVARTLGLTGVLVLKSGTMGLYDPQGDLYKTDPAACCAARKTAPLTAALKGFDGWITGRKRFQSGTRSALQFFEAEPGTDRIKVNPLAHWSPQDLQGYIAENALPRHPLLNKGYPSIGCAPCTSAVAPGENPRAGRWRGSEKDECGIHFVNGKLVRSGPHQASK